MEISKLYDYDIILLGVMLPDVQGYKMLQRLRAGRVVTPILILSDLAAPDHKVKALDFGADDFLTKPFDPRELIARVRAIVRRSKGHPASVIQTGRLVVNLDTRIASVDDRQVRLTGKEYAILELLSLRKGTTVTKETFLNHLYGGIDEPERPTIDVFVCNLRRKLALATGGRHYIETAWGRGYVLRDPAAMAAPTLVAGQDNLGACRDDAGTRAADQRTGRQASRPRPQVVQPLDRIEKRLASRRDGVRDNPVGRRRAPRIELSSAPRRASAPVEMRFEDVVTKNGGPLHLAWPDPGRSLFG